MLQVLFKVLNMKCDLNFKFSKMPVNHISATTCTLQLATTCFPLYHFWLVKPFFQ